MEKCKARTVVEYQGLLLVPAVPAGPVLEPNRRGHEIPELHPGVEDQRVVVMLPDCGVQPLVEGLQLGPVRQPWPPHVPRLLHRVADPPASPDDVANHCGDYSERTLDS